MAAVQCEPSCFVIKVLTIVAALFLLASEAPAEPPAGPLNPPPSAPAIAPVAVRPIDTPAEALRADAAEYVRAFHVEPAEAFRRLAAQEASVPLVDWLVDSHRDRLAGVVVEHDPTYRIVIVVTGASATETLVAVGPFGVPIVLRSGARATRTQALDAIARHQAGIRAALSTPPGMGVDPRTGALLVVTKREDLDGDGDAVATETRLAAIAGVPVEVRTWGDLDANLSIDGGGRVIGSDAEQARRFVCTSGFVVTDGARSALSTAAHCPDTLRFVGLDRRQTPLTMIGAWGAGHQDVQLHSAEVPLQPTFHADDEARMRAVDSWRRRASTRAGDFVCHRGQRSGYSCALVQFVDYAPPGELCAGPCPATWVAVSGPACSRGDSGGPVFVGSTAFGLVKGASSADGACKLYYYMSTDYLPAGWTVSRRQ